MSVDIYLWLGALALNLVTLAVCLNESRRAMDKSSQIWDFIMRRSRVAAQEKQLGTYRTGAQQREREKALK